MANTVAELGNLLRGDQQQQQQQDPTAAELVAQAQAAAVAAAADTPGFDISKLSQLSDFADKAAAAEQAPHHPYAVAGQAQDAAAAAHAAHAAAAAGIPHDHHDPHAMSQQLGGGAPAQQAVATDAAQMMSAATAAAGLPGGLPMEQMMALMGGGLMGMDWGAALAGVPHMEPESAEQPGPRSRSGKPTRRGPMDEMRQLVRILVKLLPQSIAYIGANEEAGGGNRISEEQIKNYLEKTLGEAPRPNWGVPNGWYNYVAELFSWALGRPVDEEQCRKCAKREPGRSWEALDGELAAIGVHPHCWPLPLTLAAVRDAEKNPIAQPIPAMPAIKRGGDGETGTRRGRSAPTAHIGHLAMDLERATEYELWKHCCDVLNVLTAKQNTSPADLVGPVSNFKSQAKAQMDILTAGALNMLQYVPVMGLDGTQQSMMALFGGMPMGLPSVTGQLVGPDGQILAADAAAVAAAAAAQAMGGEAAMGAPMGGHGDERAAKRARHEGEEGGETTDEDKGDKAPMSSTEARGMLTGALEGDAAKQQQEALAQAQQLQQQLQYAPLPVPGMVAALPPGFPNLMAGGFPAADGGAQAGEAPAAAPAEGQH